MISPQPTSTPQAGPNPISTTAEARALIGHLGDVMNALLGIVDEETELVRAGHLTEIARLEPTKADLAKLYLADAARLKLSMPYLKQAVPDALDDLRRHHDTFHALLQINLTVLATAQAVSEGIMRGVSTELARQAAPQTYGASGRQAVLSPRKGGLALTVSRIM